MSVWDKMNNIKKARSKELRRRMEQYDNEVFYPAIKEVQAECAASGHGPSEVKWNGLGYNWRECLHCGARIETWSDNDCEGLGDE